MGAGSGPSSWRPNDSAICVPEARPLTGDDSCIRDKIRERYYAHRAPVYDATSYRGDPEVDAGLDRETAEISALLPQALTARSTILEVGCGTGVWTQFLPGRVTAMDQCQGMLDIARTRVPDARLVLADFPPLPFPDASFDTLFTANFYGLLRPDERCGCRELRPPSSRGTRH